MTARSGKRRTVIAALSVIAAMGALTAFSAPLYRAFCQVTGFGGVPQTGPVEREIETSDVVVEVSFNADREPDLPWRFRPAQRSVDVRMGEPQLVFYEATNLSDQPLVGMATFNVTPQKVGYFFVKTECFCFQHQVLQPGETVRMPVSFFVDPEMLEDFDAKDVRQITLSYTFFESPDQSDAAAAASALGGDAASADNG